jgi:hypothetical protein
VRAAAEVKSARPGITHTGQKSSPGSKSSALAPRLLAPQENPRKTFSAFGFPPPPAAAERVRRVARCGRHGWRIVRRSACAAAMAGSRAPWPGAAAGAGGAGSGGRGQGAGCPAVLA